MAKEQLDIDELQTIKDNIDKDYYNLDQQRDWANEDARFCDVDGAQYDDWYREQFESRPKMEFNKVAQAVHKFVGEWASNRFGVNFTADGGNTSDSDAELLSGLFRKDFRKSYGPESIDNAVVEMAKTGFGGFRLTTEYVDEEDPENDEQKVVFEPIFTAYSSIIFDRNAKRYDKSDAMRVTYLEEMDRKAAEEEYGEDVTSAFQPPNQHRFNWFNSAKVWIANYYEIVEEKTEVIVFKDPLGRKKTVYKDEYKDFLDELADGGYEEISRRKRKRRSVWKTIVSGTKVLEEKHRIPGKMLPIIPMYGFRSYIDGKEFWYGLVRKQKDANRLFNMSATSVAESAATTSKDMPIFTDEQVEGRETQLSEMHLGKYNYAVINSLVDENGNTMPAGPVGVWGAPRVDPNNAAMMQIAADYIREETGGAPQDILDPNTSGKAINAVQARVDMNTFVLMDNIAKTLRRAGEVYRSIAAEVYETERAVNVVKEDGTEKGVNLFELVMDEETGRVKPINDVTTGSFEVTVDTGAAFASRRRETLETVKDILTITPPNSPYYPFLYSELIANLDGTGLNGLQDFNDKFKLLNGLRDPEDEAEAKQLQDQQQTQQKEQDPMQTAADAEMLKGQADMQDAQNKQQANIIDSFEAQTARMKVQVDAQVAGVKLKGDMQTKQIDNQGKQLDNVAKQQGIMENTFRQRIKSATQLTGF